MSFTGLSPVSTSLIEPIVLYAISYEFGGPVGVTSMMLGFPALMYYLWICLVFYDGRIVYPSSLQDITPFIQRMWAHIRDVSI